MRRGIEHRGSGVGGDRLAASRRRLSSALARNHWHDEPAVVWTLVAFLHVAAVWLVLQMPAARMAPAAPAMRLVYVTLPTPIPVSARRSPDPVPAPATVSIPAEVSAHVPAASMPERRKDASALERVELNDEWLIRSAPEVASKQQDGITFERNAITRHYNPIQLGPQARIRLGRQLTPQDIVRGASQILGFWPPGYTDNPCGGLEKAVEIFARGTTAREHRLLADAVEQQQRYCP